MKIGIDGTALSTLLPSGTKHYTLNLLNALSKIDRKNQYYIFTSKKTKIPNQGNFHLIELKPIPIFKKQILLPFLVHKLKLDVFHFLTPYGSVFLKRPKIITTVHDMDLNQTYPIISKYIFNRISCEITRFMVLRNTNYFISVSDAIKEELKEYLGKDVTKTIKTVYEGVGQNYKFSTKLNNSGKYYLVLADFSPRKNTTAIIKAYSLLPKDVRVRYILKIVCSNPQFANKLRSYVNKEDLKSKVEIIENVSNKRIILYYNEAIALVYTSLYEGFGLPILEAMACGCPVITSNLGAMREVAGSSAILVDPGSPMAISRAMVKVAVNQKIRRELTSRGIKVAKLFNWEKTAKQTLSVYKSFK